MFATLDALLPGHWKVSFLESDADVTGSGVYTFKLAGTFNADVRDAINGRATWHGYWEFDEAQLRLYAHEVAPGCSSCIGGGYAVEWCIDLEQVSDDMFTGTLHVRESGGLILFERC
jgi:hypothetical protein